MDLFRAEIEATDDSGAQQLLRMLGMPGEQLARVHRLNPYGLASHAKAGSHGLGVAIGGRRDQVMFIGGEAEGSRPRDLPAEAVALYGPNGKIMKILPQKIETDLKNEDSHTKDGRRIQHDATDWIWSKGKAVFLGRTGPWFPVVTTSGPSDCVFASLGPAAPNAMTGGY